MKTIKLIILALATIVVSSNVWAATTTVTWADVASANSWENGKAYTPVTVGNFTFTASGGGNNAKYYTSDNTWRFYSGGGLTITGSSGYTITSVTSKPETEFTISNGEASISFSATVKYTEITITYNNGGCTTATVLTDNVNYTIGSGSLDMTEYCFESENTNTPTFTCTSANASSCTISGANFSTSTAGTYTIKATQIADGTYCAVDESFTITAVEQGASNIVVKYNDAPINAIDFGNVTSENGDRKVRVIGTGLVDLGSYGYAMSAYLDGGDASSFFVNSNSTYNFTSLSEDITITYWVEDEGAYSTDLIIWGYDAGLNYISKTIPISVNYATACTAISPTLSYTSSTTIGNVLNPTLNKDGSTGDVTYSIAEGTAATVNASTGVLTANSVGKVKVRATIAKAGGKCSASAVSNEITISCNAISPSLSYASSATIGDVDLMPTLNKDGSEGTVTYSIKTGSGATVNSSTGALHATAAGSVTVQATIAASGDKCEGSAVSNTITISSAPVYATVTWVVDGTTYQTTTNVPLGSTISTPDNPAAPASCGDAIFKGWTANQDYFHETAAPSDLFNGTSPTINGNITFYAIFADRQE